VICELCHRELPEDSSFCAVCLDWTGGRQPRYPPFENPLFWLGAVGGCTGCALFLPIPVIDQLSVALAITPLIRLGRARLAGTLTVLLLGLVAIPLLLLFALVASWYLGLVIGAVLGAGPAAGRVTIACCMLLISALAVTVCNWWFRELKQSRLFRVLDWCSCAILFGLSLGVFWRHTLTPAFRAWILSG